MQLVSRVLQVNRVQLVSRLLQVSLRAQPHRFSQHLVQMPAPPLNIKSELSYYSMFMCQTESIRPLMAEVEEGERARGDCKHFLPEAA